MGNGNGSVPSQLQSGCRRGQRQPKHLKIFQFPRETPAAPCQSRNIMAQIGIDSPYRNVSLLL